MRKPLIAVFSAQGNTMKVGKKLAEKLSCPLYAIKAKEPYTAADLDWNNAHSRSSVEMHNPASRPDLADTNAPIADHDVIFLGFPIWWYIAPTIINTFLEHYDFSGKTVILFATSGGSGFGKAKEHLQASAPKATFLEGAVLRGSDDVQALVDMYTQLAKA
ncbi:MAG: NAD(P)H-dependent oxidoreductase [Desulfovibrio sp.]|nr:NAD(P)H-dependent oxidoreductase [Desulfovibrio sp.]